jgi:enterochelin esterase family protein
MNYARSLLFPIAFGFLFLTAAADNDIQLPYHTGVTSPRLELLKKQVESGNMEALHQFWEEMKTNHTPLVEPIPGDPNHVLLTFLYQGQKVTQKVVIYSQLSASRDPSVNVLTHLPGTDVWYKTYWMRNDMRVSYSFVPDPTPESLDRSESQIPDPLNPKSVSPQAGNMGSSILELPGAPPQPWIVPVAGVPPGKVEEFQIESKVLKSHREALIYTPAGYDPKSATPYSLLVVFDAYVYNAPGLIPGPTILDNLIAQKKIPPMVAVLVGQSGRRTVELSNNQEFLDFLSNELLPAVREKWRATSEPARTIVCGSSAGGLASVFAAYRRPDVFGNVLSQSGAFWPGKERDNSEHEWLTRQFESSPRLPIRFVLQVGLLEVVSTPGNGPSILNANRHLRDVLTAKGYELHYSEIAGGHEPLSWRGGLAEGLIQLMGQDKRQRQ